MAAESSPPPLRARLGQTRELVEQVARRLHESARLCATSRGLVDQDPMLVTSRTCIEGNERLLLVSRHLLKVSRRILDHPHLKIRGGSGETEDLPWADSPADAQSSVRKIVRASLLTGALWPIRGAVQWAGYGSGKACCVCGKPVKRSEIEYECDDGGRRLPGCHFACFVVWYEESRTFGGSDGIAC